MSKSDLRQFNYIATAKLDCEIWRAYYEHKFLQMTWLMFKLFRTQMRTGIWTTLGMSYHFSFASIEFRLNKNHLQSKRSLNHLVKFYKLVSAHSSKPFDYAKAGELELAWWNDHRYKPTNAKLLEKDLAATFAVVYHVSPKQLSNYAKYRAEADRLRNHYMHTQKVEPDWAKLESLLIKSWKSLHAAVQK